MFIFFRKRISACTIIFHTCLILICFFVLCIYYPVLLNAQEDISEPVGSDEVHPPDYEYTEPDFGENKLSYPMLVLRTLAVLAVIIIGIYFLFRFLLKKRHKFIADSEIIKVHSSYPLTSNKVIQIVEVAEKILVLGISDSSINLITTIEDKETIDKIRLLSSKESRGAVSFKDQFLKLIGGKAYPKSNQVSYFNNYKKRINKMKDL